MKKMKNNFLITCLLLFLFSCIKEEEVIPKKNNFFTLKTPQSGEIFQFNDTINVLGTYFIHTEKYNSLLNYMVSIKNLNSNEILFRDTLSQKGEDLAYFYRFQNNFIDTTEILIQVNANPSSGNYISKIVERTILCLPN
jgi:hypothetical protein